jgi:hypothetical protein
MQGANGAWEYVTAQRNQSEEFADPADGFPVWAKNFPVSAETGN